MGFPGGASGKEPACQCRRCRFDPWIGKILCRRKWQPTPVFLPGESHGQRSLVRLQRGGHNWSNLAATMTSDAEHHFIGLDALCVSPSVKHLLRSFAHLFNWLVFLFSFKYSFRISEYKSLISYVICICFLIVCVLSWDCAFLQSSLGNSESLVQSPSSD